MEGNPAQNKPANPKVGRPEEICSALEIVTYLVVSGTISTLDTVMAPFSILPFRVT